jgi:hypothetical protein
MSKTEDNKDLGPESTEVQPSKKHQKPVRKTQTQILQEALGLKQGEIEEVEKKLFIARFFDYFSEETFDFIYKERSIQMYETEISRFFDSVEKSDKEEDKLLKKSYENKKIIENIKNLKRRAEEYAFTKGKYKQPIDKRLRKLRLIISLPLFGVLLILMFFIPIWYVFPLLCLFCVGPQLMQTQVLRKWWQFKEENKNTFYTENRGDIMILKSMTGEFLQNIRANLLDMKVPLQIIKFVLHSRDYENLKLINQRMIKGTNQYFFEFEYPPGMEPFPIPEALLPPKPAVVEGPKAPEKNFIILKELKAHNGIINSFVPILKTILSNQINKMLNESEFAVIDKNIKEIIPNYSENMAIYCLCGDIAQIINIQMCTWKNQFKYYLFEGSDCKCGEKIYALSLMDDSESIPEELKEIFLS